MWREWCKHGSLAVVSVMRVVRLVHTRAATRSGGFGAAAASVVIVTGGVRSGRPESTAAFIFSWLLAEQRPLNGVAPPLECWQRPPGAGELRPNNNFKEGGIERLSYSEKNAQYVSWSIQ